MTGVSVTTLTDEVELGHAWPNRSAQVLQFWELTCATDANTVAVTSAISGLKRITGIYLGKKDTAKDSAAVIQTTTGAAFTVLAKTSTTVYAIVLGSKIR